MTIILTTIVAALAAVIVVLGAAVTVKRRRSNKGSGGGLRIVTPSWGPWSPWWIIAIAVAHATVIAMLAYWQPLLWEWMLETNTIRGFEVIFWALMITALFIDKDRLEGTFVWHALLLFVLLGSLFFRPGIDEYFHRAKFATGESVATYRVELEKDYMPVFVDPDVEEFSFVLGAGKESKKYCWEKGQRMVFYRPNGVGLTYYVTPNDELPTSRIVIQVEQLAHRPDVSLPDGVCARVVMGKSAATIRMEQVRLPPPTS